MKLLKSVLTLLLFTAVLVGCGGGGSASESFTSTITIGPTSHVCTSPESANACVAGNCSQCKCLAGCPAAPGEAIKLACLFYDGVARVPSTGCTLATTPERTLVCSEKTLYILDGVGKTKEEVMSGVQFNGSGALTFNGLQLACSLN